VHGDFNSRPTDPGRFFWVLRSGAVLRCRLKNKLRQNGRPPAEPGGAKIPAEIPENQGDECVGQRNGIKEKARGRYDLGLPLSDGAPGGWTTGGSVLDIGDSRAQAWREVGRLGLDIHAGPNAERKRLFREMAQHFREHELEKRSGIGVRARETAATLECLLDRCLLPRWGEKMASEIRPLEIEAWFEALTSTAQGARKRPLSWASIAKIKSVMAQVFKHAQRYELIPVAIGKDEVAAGEEITLLSREQDSVSISEILRLFIAKDLAVNDFLLVRRAHAQNALPDSWKQYFYEKVSRSALAWLVPIKMELNRISRMF